ncbi:prominin-like protein isoform X2 [Macrosteles quadrilineatus]|uniref:prominin-like protein isoform X2 n=1 Tax=Macrosteles quadrilineatus TaxID=74068 RepID=UPI0023E19E42|nr:prominin-like protein isoform X2 [Macrosteles quadrilineatus]
MLASKSGLPDSFKMLIVSAVICVILVRESSCVVSRKQQQRLLQLAQKQNYNVPTSNPNVPSYQELNLPFEQIKYSVADVSNDYNSTTKHYPRGMGHLYFITKTFMNIIFPGELYPEGIIRTRPTDGRLDVADIQEEWRALVRHYGLLALVVLVGLVFVVVVPVVGLFFCCCRCAGRCGARSQPFEKRYDPCRRHTNGFFLSCITIMIAFGVVCAFVTNEYLETGTRSLPNDLKTSLTDTDLYLNNTKKEVNNLLVTNYGELETTLNTILHKSGEIMKEQLGEVSKAEVISNLTTIVKGLSIIRSDLSNIDSLSVQLKDKAIELEQALRETRENLMEKLRQCQSQPACIEFLRTYNITHLNIETDFAHLPNVTASLQNVSALLESDIEQEVTKGQQEFEKVRDHIQRIVDEGKPLISDAIKRAGIVCKEGADKITNMLDRARDIMLTQSKEPIHVGEQFLHEYGPYQHYLGLGVSCTLLVVLSCLTFGLFCGYCGKRPDGGYNDDCCDKGTGARFLMLGVWVMFLSWAVLMVVTVFYFMTGVLADRAVCYTMRHPESRLFQLVDQQVPLRLYGSPQRPVPPLRLSSIVRKCHANESLYNVLELRHLVDISKYPQLPQEFGINHRIEELTGKIRLENHVDILTPSAKQQLIRLANSPLNQFNLTIYTKVLNEKITSIDLMTLANAIAETAKKLPPSQIKIKNSLMFQAQYLELHQQNQVSAMHKLVVDLNENAANLTDHLRFNEPSLKLAVEKMLRQVEAAQHMLNEKGPQIISKIAADFASEFTVHITDYMNRVVDQVETSVGKCWPISQVYNATITTTCSKILDPYNGFWASVGFILVLFIPSIILSVKLAALYQKSDPYPGPLVEAEYLYDAYADRDNIPLANVNEKKKKKPQQRYVAEPYDNSGASGAGSGAERSRSSGATSSEPRFTDMAPKHWDFPNMGGPPRYNSSPLSTEYERPPPYYYPGPSPTPRS